MSADRLSELPAYRVPHFASAAQQRHAAHLGMWIFLGTEILLFAGLFVGYAEYRHLFAREFREASHHLDRVLGTIETLVLIASSLTMALSLHFTHVRRRGLATLCLLATIALGLTFLGIHGYEYAHHASEGILPGAHYAFEALPLQGAVMFFTLYYLMTGLHSVHVLAGVLVLSLMAFRSARGDFTPEYLTPLELTGMYWHLVDGFWVFLYPLLYLV